MGLKQLTNPKDPVTGTNWNLTSPLNSGWKYLGMVIALGLFYSAAAVAQATISPLVTGVVNSLTGGRLSGGSESGNNLYGRPE